MAKLIEIVITAIERASPAFRRVEREIDRLRDKERRGNAELARGQADVTRTLKAQESAYRDMGTVRARSVLELGREIAANRRLRGEQGASSRALRDDTEFQDRTLRRLRGIREQLQRFQERGIDLNERERESLRRLVEEERQLNVAIRLRAVGTRIVQERLFDPGEEVVARRRRRIRGVTEGGRAIDVTRPSLARDVREAVRAFDDLGEAEERAIDRLLRLRGAAVNIGKDLRATSESLDALLVQNDEHVRSLTQAFKNLDQAALPAFRRVRDNALAERIREVADEERHATFEAERFRKEIDLLEARRLPVSQDLVDLEAAFRRNAEGAQALRQTLQTIKDADFDNRSLRTLGERMSSLRPVIAAVDKEMNRLSADVDRARFESTGLGRLERSIRSIFPNFRAFSLSVQESTERLDRHQGAVLRALDADDKFAFALQRLLRFLIVLLQILPAIAAVVGVLIGAIDALVGGLAALAGALLQVTGVAAALPGIFAAAAGAIGSFRLAFGSGIADVKTAFGTIVRLQDQAAENEVRNTERVRDAQEALVRAREDNAQQLQDLERNLRDTTLRNREQEQDAEQRIADTRLRVSEALQAAEERLADLRKRSAILQREIEEDLATNRAELAALRIAGADPASIAAAAGRVRAAERRKALFEVSDEAKAVERAERDKNRIRRDGERDIARAIEQRRRLVRDNAKQEQRAAEQLNRARIDGVRRVAEAERNLNIAREQAAGTLRDPLKALEPIQARVVSRLVEMRQRWLDLLEATRHRGFDAFLGFLDAIDERTPEIARTVGGFADAVVRAGDAFVTRFVRDPANFARINALFEAGIPLVDRFGEAVGNVVDALLRIGDAARRTGFTDAIAGGFFRATERLDEFVARIDGAGGALEGFLTRARRTAGLLVRSLGNVGLALLNVLNVAEPFGTTLLESFERFTLGIRQFTESTAGRASLRSYFADVIPVFRQLVGLGEAVVETFFRIGHALTRPPAGGGEPFLTRIIEVLRDSFLPFLERFIVKATVEFGPVLLTFFRDFGVVLEHLVAENGPIAILIKLADGVLRAFQKLGPQALRLGLLLVTVAPVVFRLTGILSKLIAIVFLGGSRFDKLTGEMVVFGGIIPNIIRAIGALLKGTGSLAALGASLGGVRTALFLIVVFWPQVRRALDAIGEAFSRLLDLLGPLGDALRAIGDLIGVNDPLGFAIAAVVILKLATNFGKVRTAANDLGKALLALRARILLLELSSGTALAGLLGRLRVLLPLLARFGGPIAATLLVGTQLEGRKEGESFFSFGPMIRNFENAKREATGFVRWWEEHVSFPIQRSFGLEPLKPKTGIEAWLDDQLRQLSAKEDRFRRLGGNMSEALIEGILRGVRDAPGLVPWVRGNLDDALRVVDEKRAAFESAFQSLSDKALRAFDVLRGGVLTPAEREQRRRRRVEDVEDINRAVRDAQQRVEATGAGVSLEGTDRQRLTRIRAAMKGETGERLAALEDLQRAVRQKQDFFLGEAAVRERKAQDEKTEAERNNFQARLQALQTSLETGNLKIGEFNDKAVALLGTFLGDWESAGTQLGTALVTGIQSSLSEVSIAGAGFLDTIKLQVLRLSFPGKLTLQDFVTAMGRLPYPWEAAMLNLGSVPARVPGAGAPSTFLPVETITGIVADVEETVDEVITRRKKKKTKASFGQRKAAGGAVWGGVEGAAVPILAHVGEWVLNREQQDRLARAMGGWRKARDFLFTRTTPTMSFQLGGIVPTPVVALSGGGNGVTQNVLINTSSPTVDVDYVARVLESRMSRF